MKEGDNADKHAGVVKEWEREGEQMVGKDDGEVQIPSLLRPFLQ